MDVLQAIDALFGSDASLTQGQRLAILREDFLRAVVIEAAKMDEASQGDNARDVYAAAVELPSENLLRAFSKTDQPSYGKALGDIVAVFVDYHDDLAEDGQADDKPSWLP